MPGATSPDDHRAHDPVPARSRVRTEASVKDGLSLREVFDIMTTTTKQARKAKALRAVDVALSLVDAHLRTVADQWRAKGNHKKADAMLKSWNAHYRKSTATLDIIKLRRKNESLRRRRQRVGDDMLRLRRRP